VLECRRRYQSGAFEAIIYSIFLNVKSKSTIRKIKKTMRK
jgi:hypothetical protein